MDRHWNCRCLYSLFFMVFLGTNSLSAEEPVVMPIHQRANVAHRGASYLAPENTLTAYRIAISAGAQGAECDVYTSSDGVVVLSHDKSTKRALGGGDRDITTMTFEEIRELDAGAWKGKQFKNEKVPTLDEYLELLEGTTCHPVIEIKMEGIETPVLDAVRKRNMLDVSTIIAFSQTVVKEIRRQEPSISVAYLYSERLQGNAEENAVRLGKILIAKAEELDTNLLDLDHRILSSELVQTLRDAGVHVWCWTVNDAVRMNTLLDWGVESITTDRPELLNDVLRERNKRPTP